MKQSGLGDNLYVGGYDLSGDVGALGSVSGGPQALDLTPINASGHVRLGGQRSGQISYTAFFNDAAGAAHPVLSALPTTDTIATYCRGTTLGNPAACLVAKQVNYDPTRAADGMLTFGVDAQSNAYGLEWGDQLTAGLRTDTGATNGTSVDFGAAGTNGLQAYLQVTAFTGTDVTVTIEESSDDGAGDAFASVAAFTQVTSGPTWERITAAGGVERYLRVATSTSGGFTSCTFSVVVVVNATAVVF